MIQTVIPTWYLPDVTLKLLYTTENWSTEVRKTLIKEYQNDKMTKKLLFPNSQFLLQNFIHLEPHIICTVSSALRRD